ncbi:cytohesin-4-like isoform X1 [Solea senegalensis]|uniref:Cytohesin-4-like isoform X1 n=1 Tax=Solea senegalensis TaxID=28829 RepID=A0AAV6RML8_SOLSE|nr:cytohesin-4-like [Solea senegalensis]KAG7505111.1 cytohesin-4-like isoform X1 [Solea senegalensis]
MAICRKDSFLWGRAHPSLPAAESRPGETIKIHKSELLDDIQNLRPQIKPVETQIHRREVEEQNKNVVRNRRFLRGKKKFNMDPKTGFIYLVTNNLLEWRAESVAEFLYKEEGLNKTAIGNFLGDREDMHLETLKAFVSLHEFSDLNLVQALRQFLWSFRLPGEAQKIDRMMEAFATRYCDCNPGVFQSTDTCYILSFAIIMLNTSLHNPNVKDKPSLQRFVSMNRGINNGDDLSTELLAKLYASIRSEPFKIPEDDGHDLTLTFFNPDREGWLLKMGGRVKTWKRRWFILTDSCLYYFKYTTDKDPIGIIPLENLSVRKLQEGSKSYCLELFNPKGQKIKACKTENKGQVVQGKHRSYKLSAASADERDTWMDAIRASVTKDPFYDLVSLRKRKVICNADPTDLSGNNT